MQPETIAAPATPPGYGGVSIIRISGPLSKKIATLVSNTKNLENRKATLLPIYNQSRQKIDTCLVTYFKAPASYTGEDVLEISCHGSPAITELILDTVLQSGAKIAQPGEFTKRAFLNGKLDLLQAESVGALIQAKSKSAIRMNNRVLKGDLSKKLLSIRESLKDSLATIEFEFDISEDESQLSLLHKALFKKIEKNTLVLKDLLLSYDEGRIYNYGAKVVICGRPNVGKSTLLNTLIGKERAITSHSPGTTRDTIDSNIILSGIPITITDTAGIRSKTGPIETEGIKKGRTEIDLADLIVFVFTENHQVVDFIKDKTNIIRVFNKNDILKKPSINMPFVSISAKQKTGISTLKKNIISQLMPKNRSESGVHLTSKRQKDAVLKCVECLNRAFSLMNSPRPELEIIALELKDGITHLDELLGKTSTDDILNKLFSTFCVGK